MATILRMPEVLANATEAVLANWLVEEGKPFSAGDPLAEIETEKAVVEFTAEADGILGRYLTRSGDATEVGAPIAVVITAGETDADIDAVLGDRPVAPAAAPKESAVRPSAVPGAAVAPSRETAITAENMAGPSVTARLFSSPLARRIAKEHGIDPRTVNGTGPGRRIVRRDVESAIVMRQDSAMSDGMRNGKSATRPVDDVRSGGRLAPVQRAGYTAIPHTGVRRAVARRLTESKSTVPHFYVTTDCRVDELLALRKQVNEALSVKISVNDLVIKAVAAAFQDVPDANVTWSDDELRRYDDVDIAVAVATDGGLLTPVVRGVNRLSLSGVSASIFELVRRARAGRLRQDELEGGSFSVTNLGMYGTREFSAILNPPQAGILAVGAARPQAVVTDGALAVATVMRCTLSVDHRAVDGALAAQWLAAFTARIENPISILV